ncbi:hypothetical protein Q4494_17450 [Celeribacter halophilus]|uniref:Uncharacterized protein n=1 Tax=Celeribacter halophilus TaxID=576117 RepID=A0AAW7XX35_9RHOB|nr:hypothetical protein [Celeribacter halophilus]MDO6458871.1 hypothetical protein [Celeribacter halophilus]
MMVPAGSGPHVNGLSTQIAAMLHGDDEISALQQHGISQFTELRIAAPVYTEIAGELDAKIAVDGGFRYLTKSSLFWPRALG